MENKQINSYLTYLNEGIINHYDYYCEVIEYDKNGFNKIFSIGKNKLSDTGYVLGRGGWNFYWFN